MSENADGILAALGRLGIQITRLSDQLATRLDRSEKVRFQTCGPLTGRMDRSTGTIRDFRHDVAVHVGMIGQVRPSHGSSPREELMTVNETISLLVKRIRLLETDVRTLRSGP